MKAWTSSSSSPYANTNGNATLSESNTSQGQAPRRNSRFIPEAERGWYTPEPITRPTSSMMRRSSSGQSTPSGWFESRRRSSITALKAKWVTSPAWERKQLPKGQEVLTGYEDALIAPEIEMTEEAEEEEEDAFSSDNDEEDDDNVVVVEVLPLLNAREPR